MKVKAVLFGMFLLAGTANAFANSDVKAKKAIKPAKTENIKFIESKKEIINPFVKAACTVTVAYGSTTVKISIECDCTQRQACDAAYKLATIAI